MPGGKTQLLPELMTRLPTKFNRYIEPFVRATGACAALAEIRVLTVLFVRLSVPLRLLSMPPPRAGHPVPWAVAPASASLPVIVQPLTFNVAPPPPPLKIPAPNAPPVRQGTPPVPVGNPRTQMSLGSAFLSRRIPTTILIGGRVYFKAKFTIDPTLYRENMCWSGAGWTEAGKAIKEGGSQSGGGVAMRKIDQLKVGSTVVFTKKPHCQLQREV